MPTHCLVVDDDPAFLETVRRVLGRQGISVVGVTATSAEAAEVVPENRPPGNRDPNCLGPPQA